MSRGIPLRVWVEQRLGSMACLAYNNPGRALATAALVTVLLGAFAARLSLVADLTELLPESFPSVQDLESVKERFGGIGYVVVVGIDAEPDQLRQFADDVARELDAMKLVRYVEFRRPAAFFEDRLLYFLETDDLQTIADRVGARYEWERKNKNPLLIDFENEEPPPLDFSDIERSQQSRSDQRWMQSQLGEPYYVDAKQRMVAILAKPASPSFELAFASEMVCNVKAAVDRLDLTSYGPEFNVGYTGRYVRAVDQQWLIKKDLRLSSALALVLVLTFLAVYFRGVFAVILIIVPLCVALVWTYGIARLIFENLNILTGFIGAILLGLGIDHGIHLLARFKAEFHSNDTVEQAVQRTFASTGRAVTVAAITTAVGFAGLGLSEFRAFREFGVISAIGMILVVVANVSCMPALIGFLTARGWRPKAARSEGASGFANRLPRMADKLLVASLLLVLLACTQIPKARFNYNFKALEAHDLPSFILDRHTNEILGYSQSPAVVLTDGLAEERDVAAALRARQAELGEQSTIDFVVATTDLIPADQERKHEAIAALDRVVRKAKPGWLEPKHRPYLPVVKRMTQATPFTMDDLPMEVRRQFQGISASRESGFVLVFPAIELTMGSEVSRFAKEVRGVQLPSGKRVSAAGEDMILADIFDMVTREAPPVLSLTLALIVATLWLLLGTWRLTLLCLVPAATTLAVTFGLLHWVALELNYLNIVMIPVIFGIGVDGAAHILTRVQAGRAVHTVLEETGSAISGAVLTTGLGFGALLVADHPGLESLGLLALVGLAVNALASLVLLPAFVAYRSRGQNDAPVSVC